MTRAIRVGDWPSKAQASAHKTSERRKRLRERSAFIVVLRNQGYTLCEIGERCGISRERVRQILDKVQRSVAVRLRWEFPEICAALYMIEANLIRWLIAVRYPPG